VLDLDETLIHYRETEHNAAEQEVLTAFEAQNGREPTQQEWLSIQPAVLFNERPQVREFLAEMSRFFEVVVFTAAEQNYADQVLDQLDPNGCVTHRLYRQHTVTI